jgi:hypothetical protein
MDGYGIEIEGDKEINDFLMSLDKNIRDSAIKAGAKKAADPVITRARSILKIRAKSRGRDGMSKISYIMRNIVAEFPAKRFGLGVNIKVKGNDIPVGDRFWKIFGYAILLGEGSYNVKTNRKTRGTGANRGYFRGFGNFIQNAWKQKGDVAKRIFMDTIDREVLQAMKRSNKATQRRLNG